MEKEELLEWVVRNGLFLAASRTYGEQYVEPFVREWYGLNEATYADHDAVGTDGTKYEIKSCKVMKSSVNRRGSRTLLQRVLYENDNLSHKRAVPFSDAKTAKYDANVQNVKRDHFDILIYVLLFADCLKIFWANAEDIKVGQFRGWSDRHGRYDQPGKSGQFNVTKSTIEWHIENHLKETISYEDLANTFSKMSGTQ